MGRPREHDETTRAALLEAAEALVADGGPDALSVRAVAEAVGVSTRAVYTLFGSRDGLLVALAQEAFALLTGMLAARRPTRDPARDLVELGLTVFRRFVLEHPSMYRLAFQRIVPTLPLGPEFFDARQTTWTHLSAWVERLDEAGLLAGRTLDEGTAEFNAMCEGMANAELRGGTMAPGDPDQIWRNGLTAVIEGLAITPRPRRRSARGQ